MDFPIYGIKIIPFYVQKIIDGEKTWEVRSQNISSFPPYQLPLRIALCQSSKKVDGQYVALGEATVYASEFIGYSRTDEERCILMQMLGQYKDYHNVTDEYLKKYLENRKKIWIWKLSNVVKFETPKAFFNHPNIVGNIPIVMKWTE